MSAVMQVLYQIVLVNRELRQKPRNFRFSSCFSNLICGHKLWVVTEKMRLQIQMAKISFFSRDMVKSSDGVVSIFLHFKGSELRWFRHLIRISPGHFHWGIHISSNS